MSYFSDTEEFDVYRCISKEFYDDIYSEIDIEYPSTPPDEKDIDNIISMYSWPERCTQSHKVSTGGRVCPAPKTQKWWKNIFKRKMK